MKKLIGPLAAVLMFGSACLGNPEDQTVRNDDGAIEEGGELGVFAIQVGDCINNDDATEVFSVDGQSCDEPHDSEIYHAFDIVASEYPGDDAIITQAEAGCLGAFEGFVGLDYNSSILDISYLYPTQESWAQADDREVLCMIVSLDGSPLTGSARGLGI